MDIANYARISTEKQDTTNQLEQLRAFARTQRWRIVLELEIPVKEPQRQREPLPTPEPQPE